jgi:polyisoprenoid-binding protein YceI
MKKALLFAVPLICAVPLLAQSAPQIPGTKDISRVTAGTYQADPGHTLIGWNVNHFGFTDYFGIFGDVSGTLVLDPEAPGAAKIDMIIPVSKVTHCQHRIDRAFVARWKGWRNTGLFRTQPF